MSEPARPRFIACVAGIWLILTWTLPAISADRSRPVVAGFERFAGGLKADATASGLLLLGELNCTSCHKATPAIDARLIRKQGPILDAVGGRVEAAYLRAFLADPHAVKPGTTMPDLLRGWPEAEKTAAVEALTHFLASGGELSHSRPNRKTIVEGGTLYHRVGCVACHGRLDDTKAAASDGPRPVPLGDLAAKYTIPSLSAFVLDPLKVRPSGRMPGLKLSSQEANAIAQYLLKDLRVSVKPNLAYRYYEGNWDKLPDFAKLKPVADGTSEGFDLSKAERKGRFGLSFDGFLRIDRDGRYTFHLRSDDGSRLLIDHKLIVDNDGNHPTQDKDGSVKLLRGMHPIGVNYFDAGGEAELGVEFDGPGIARQDISNSLSLRDEVQPKSDDRDRFVVDPAKSQTGRDLFARIGCASCHQRQSDGKAITPRNEARALAEIAGATGG